MGSHSGRAGGPHLGGGRGGGSRTECILAPEPTGCRPRAVGGGTTANGSSHPRPRPGVAHGSSGPLEPGLQEGLFPCLRHAILMKGLFWA